MAPAFADANQFNGPRHLLFLLLQKLQLQVFFYLIILVFVAYSPLGKTGSLPLWEPHQSLLLSLDGVWPTVLTSFKAEHASEYVSRNISQCAEPTGSYLRFMSRACPNWAAESFPLFVNLFENWPTVLLSDRHDMPYVVPRYTHTRALLCILRRLGFSQASCPAFPFLEDKQRLQKSGLFLTRRGGFGPRGHPCPSHRLAFSLINFIDRRNLSKTFPFYGRECQIRNFRLSLRPTTAWGVILKGWHPFLGSTRYSRPPGPVLATSLAGGSSLVGKLLIPRHSVFNVKHFDEGNLALSVDVKLNTLVLIEYYAYITFYLRKGNHQISIRRSCGDMYNCQYLLCIFINQRYDAQTLAPLDLIKTFREPWISKKIVKPSNYGLKNYCVALSGPPLDLNDYSLAPPTRRLQNRNRTASTNG